jgi:hypothetical protein
VLLLGYIDFCAVRSSWTGDTHRPYAPITQNNSDDEYVMDEEDEDDESDDDVEIGNIVSCLRYNRKFDNRVKLKQIISILVVMWEEEEEE